MTTVVAAILVRQGKILACQRRRDQTHPGKWEFPGGKVELGERPEDALERELSEELGIEAVIGPRVAAYEYAYPGRDPISLLFFRVDEFVGEPDYSQFQEARWVEPGELGDLDFLEGDVEIIRLLQPTQSSS